MKKRVLSILRYLLSAFLGFWTLSFMESSAFYIKGSFGAISTRSSVDMYESITFSMAPAVSAAAVFQIFMIIIAIALLALGAAKIMELHGLKLPAFAKKIYALKIAKKFDLVILLAFALTFFSFLTMICLAVYAGQASYNINAVNFLKYRLGFGPVWLLLFGIFVSAALLFEDKIKAFISKEKPTKVTDGEVTEPATVSIEPGYITPPEPTAYTAHHEDEEITK